MNAKVKSENLKQLKHYHLLFLKTTHMLRLNKKIITFFAFLIFEIFYLSKIHN